MGKLLRIGGLTLDTDHIMGYALINDLPMDTPMYTFKLPDGLYPIVYFDERTVLIAVDVDEPDFMNISRDDFEWINI
jgi:hypothetical protein